jgi:hypothetical protein
MPMPALDSSMPMPSYGCSLVHSSPLAGIVLLQSVEPHIGTVVLQCTEMLRLYEVGLC